MYLLMVQDMDRAVDFYTNVIGFQKRSASPGWSELAFGDFTLALHGGGSGEGKKTGLSFTASDLDSACEEVEAAGGKVIKAPYEGPVAGLRLWGARPSRDATFNGKRAGAQGQTDRPGG